MLKVVVDRREQRPWQLDPSAFLTIPATLQTGDYSLAGLEDTVAIERKSLGDLVQTTIQDWRRFRKELYRLAAFDTAAIVVEADVADLFGHRYESDANPLSVWGRCNSCFLDHGVPVFWWGPRELCQQAVERFLILTAKKYSLAGV